MAGTLITCAIILGVIMFFMIIGAIKQINQYQAGIVFTQGRYTKTLGPGWHIIIPIFQHIRIVDLRIMTVEVEGQDTMTKDNVSVHINAVIYYKITDPAKAVIDIQDVDWAVNQLAQTTMRNIVGSFLLDDVLSKRKEISDRIEGVVEHTTTQWGVHIQIVDLKDVKLPEGLKRTMAKVAEADRERRANILMSEGEVVAAGNLAKAADTMQHHPGALHIRTLNSINDISSDQSNTIVFMVPMELLRAMEGFTQKVKNDTKS